MKRQEAQLISKEIAESCKLLDPSQVSLQQPSARHFQIYIKGTFDEKKWRCLKEIVEKHKLALKLADDTIIICKQGDI